MAINYVEKVIALWYDYFKYILKMPKTVERGDIALAGYIAGSIKDKEKWLWGRK